MRPSRQIGIVRSLKKEVVVNKEKKELKVLVVDDEKDFAESMSFWFGYKGYYVIIATDGETGLKLIDEKNGVYRIPIAKAMELVADENSKRAVKR